MDLKAVTSTGFAAGGRPHANYARSRPGRAVPHRNERCRNAGTAMDPGFGGEQPRRTVTTDKCAGEARACGLRRAGRDPRENVVGSHLRASACDEARSDPIDDKERCPCELSYGPALRAACALLARIATLFLATFFSAGIARAAAMSDDSITTVAATAKPNVVIVLADDLDTHSLTRMLNVGMMPELKSKVIEPGTQFSNSFVTTVVVLSRRGPRCSRDCIRTITACSPTADRWAEYTVSTIRPRLATWLQKSGLPHRTGRQVPQQLRQRQRPHHTGGRPALRPPGWNDWQGLMDKATDGRRAFQMYDYTINDNGTLVQARHRGRRLPDRRDRPPRSAVHRRVGVHRRRATVLPAGDTDGPSLGRCPLQS